MKIEFEYLSNLDKENSWFWLSTVCLLDEKKSIDFDPKEKVKKQRLWHSKQTRWRKKEAKTQRQLTRSFPLRFYLFPSALWTFFLCLSNHRTEKMTCLCVTLRIFRLKKKIRDNEGLKESTKQKISFWYSCSFRVSST